MYLYIYTTICAKNLKFQLFPHTSHSICSIERDVSSQLIIYFISFRILWLAIFWRLALKPMISTFLSWLLEKNLEKKAKPFFLVCISCWTPKLCTSYAWFLLATYLTNFTLMSGLLELKKRYILSKRITTTFPSSTYLLRNLTPLLLIQVSLSCSGQRLTCFFIAGNWLVF